MRGPKPTPDAIKIAEGTFRTQRARKETPVLTLPHDNPFDATTDAEAHECWDYLVPKLDRYGMLGELDRGHIHSYCVAWQTALRSEATLKAEGYTVEDAKGKAILHPTFRVWSDSWNKVRQLGNDLGLNYLSRLRFQDNKVKPADETEAKKASYFA